MQYEMERRRRQWNSALEGDAWNIATYELLPDLHKDPFVIGDHVP